MDANPAFCLSLLYRNDPIYSLCAPDLMTASQTVNNKFVKEQRRLMKTLRQLEHERITQKRRLEEEQKQFAFVMSKRLRPRNIHALASRVSSGSASSVRPARCIRSAPPALSTQRQGASGGNSEPRRTTTCGQCEMMTHLCHLTRSLHMYSEDRAKPAVLRGGVGSSDGRNRKHESQHPRGRNARSCPPSLQRRRAEHTEPVCLHIHHQQTK
ncbi:uncharacterized protein LOC125302232 isoform X2 [Alosa alosa]|uniref:uncharacterized protein LOC125302232 isoform X2 n=1 Tax=Alosa alosa TaxID=278164 RepID=UPI002015547F|nr:uncharacterized protein LOC125302232 isoform X2 [Alosa alosa]